MLNKLRKLKEKKGFTLVELIVVIAIIAILTAVIVPLVGRYSAQATYTTLQDAAKTISNSANNVISEITMMGTTFSCTPVTGQKSNGGQLVVTVPKASGSGNVTSTANGMTAAGGSTAIGNSTEEQFAQKLAESLDSALPNNCSFSIEITTNTVRGVVYCTAANAILPAAAGTNNGGVTANEDFSGAYEITSGSGYTGDVGVAGSFIPATNAAGGNGGNNDNDGNGG